MQLVKKYCEIIQKAKTTEIDKKARYYNIYLFNTGRIGYRRVVKILFKEELTGKYVKSKQATKDMMIKGGN